MLGYTYSVIAGFFAALASMFGKLSLSSSELNRLCNQYTAHCTLLYNQCEVVALILRGVAFVMIFITNALMWRFFAKSLSLSSTAVEATSVNTASNFLFTALFGVVLFEETITMRWLFGLSLVFTGLVMVHMSLTKTSTEELETNKDK